MAAGVGSLIQNTDYNSIRATVDSVFGKTTTGYGQTLSSADVSVGDTITALQWLNLRTDMVKARQHQIGSSVGTSTANDGRNLAVPASGAAITEAFRSQFASFASTISSNKYSVDSDSVGGQLADETLTSSVYSSTWGGSSQAQTLTHTVTITGATSGDGAAASLRYYFNAGGKFRVTASITTGTSKNNAWDQMFTQAGEFVMDYTQTTYTGSSAIGTSIGFQDLTTTDQLIGQKNAPSGSYAENRWYVYTKKSSDDTQVIITIQYVDNDAGDPNFDESVQPSLTSYVKMYRPSGSNVSVATPTATQTFVGS